MRAGLKRCFKPWRPKSLDNLASRRDPFLDPCYFVAADQSSLFVCSASPQYKGHAYRIEQPHCSPPLGGEVYSPSGGSGGRRPRVVRSQMVEGRHGIRDATIEDTDMVGRSMVLDTDQSHKAARDRNTVSHSTQATQDSRREQVPNTHRHSCRRRYRRPSPHSHCTRPAPKNRLVRLLSYVACFIVLKIWKSGRGAYTGLVLLASSPGLAVL
jgi:hypothetical protein